MHTQSIVVHAHAMREVISGLQFSIDLKQKCNLFSQQLVINLNFNISCEVKITHLSSVRLLPESLSVKCYPSYADAQYCA